MADEIPGVVVIGCSAGGLEALNELLPALPSEFRWPVVIVVHQPRDKESQLLNVFSDGLQLRTKFAEDKELLRRGVIYFAPPDYHLLVERTMSLALDADEPVMFSRPSIDLLFESASDSLRDRVIGVLLSGANADGAAGLRAIQNRGGRTIVQDPRGARYPTMPQAALDLFRPQRVLPLQAIGPALIELGAGLL